MTNTTTTINDQVEIQFERFGVSGKLDAQCIAQITDKFPPQLLEPIPKALTWDASQATKAYDKQVGPLVDVYVALSNCPEMHKDAYKIWLGRKLSGEIGLKKVKAYAYLGILFKELLSILSKLEVERAQLLKVEALEEEVRQVRNRLDRAGL